MFYISELYNFNQVQIVEGTFSEIALVVIRNTETDFCRQFTNAYEVKNKNQLIAGVGTEYLRAFDKYEVRLLSMMEFIGVDFDYPPVYFEKLPNSFQFDYLNEYDSFNLYHSAQSFMHFTVLEMMTTNACCTEQLPDGSVNIYIYCCLGNDFVKYHITDYRSFITLYTKYNIFKARRMQ